MGAQDRVCVSSCGSRRDGGDLSRRTTRRCCTYATCPDHIDPGKAGRHRMNAVSSEQFRDLIGRFASGVTVITTAADSVPYGTTASAMTSVSLTPPILLICMNRQSLTGQAICQSGHFAVNVLAEDQGCLAERFARKGSSFAGLSFTAGAQGAPLLGDALATFECTVTNTVQAGKHSVMIGTVDRAAGRQGMPLAYFRGRQGRLSIHALAGHSRVHRNGSMTITHATHWSLRNS